MTDLIERLRAFEGSDELGNGDFSLLSEAAAALEAAREDACVALVADIRFACGDNGKRMQPELVEFIRELARDAERYQWLRTNEQDRSDVFLACCRDELDAAIDAAIAAANGGGDE